MGHNQQEQNVEAAALRAVVYVRISDDPDGTQGGLDRQEADCRADAAARGWEVMAVFRENDTSAFKQRTITLPAGERVRRGGGLEQGDVLAEEAVQAAGVLILTGATPNPPAIEA